MNSSSIITIVIVISAVSLFAEIMLPVMAQPNGSMPGNTQNGAMSSAGNMSSMSNMSSMGGNISQMNNSVGIDGNNAAGK